MLIDWFTVGAQMLNFVLLIWLLRRFLYRPVLDAIDAREALVTRQVGEAAAAQATAQREQLAFKQRNEAFDADRAGLLKQATSDAQAERQRLVDAARQAADVAAAQRQDAARHEADHLRRGLADRTRDEVFAIARRVLGDLADATLEDRVVAVFLRRLAAAEPATLSALASGLDAGPPRATLRSAFAPDVPQRECLRAAIVAALSPGREGRADAAIEVVFETAPDLLGGVELVVGGRALGWNVEHYLDGLERILAPVAAPVAAAVPAPTPVPAVAT